jgi:hypothetical protein
VNKPVAIALAVVGGAAAVAGAVVLGVWSARAHAAKWQPRGAFLVPMPSGTPSLVLVDELSTTKGQTTRLTAVHAATGETEEREWGTFGATRCDVPAPNVLWCEVDGGSILDPRTLDTRASKVAEPQSHFGTVDDCGLTNIPVPGQLVVGSSGFVYRKPQLAEGEPEPAAIGGPPLADAALVLRDGALARVAGGKVAWSVPVGTCIDAVIVGKLVVYATDDVAQRALGIDLATGAVRWHVP